MTTRLQQISGALAAAIVLAQPIYGAAPPWHWEVAGSKDLRNTAKCAAMNFAGPGAIALNSKGDLFVAGDKGSKALQVLRADGGVSVLVDRRSPAIKTGRYSGISLAIDHADAVYLGFRDRGTVERLGPDGKLTVVAGKPGDRRSLDGPSGSGRFGTINGIAVSKGGDIYVIDHRAIRKVSLDGAILTLAGSNSAAYPDVVEPALNWSLGKGSSARFLRPRAIAISPRDEIYVADGYFGMKEDQLTSISLIKKISSNGQVSAFAGGYANDYDAKGSDASFGYIFGMAFDSRGDLFVVERNDSSVREVDSGASVSTLLSESDNDATPFPWEPVGIAATTGGVVYVMNTNVVYRHIDVGQLYRISQAGSAEVLCARSQS